VPRSTQIEQFLSADGAFQPLVAKTREILQLNRHCKEFLPPELAAFVRASNLRDGRLILLAANAAAGAKLRLLLPSLSDFLKQQGAKINSVSVRVQPATVNRSRSGATPGRRLSPAGYSALSALYDTLGDSPARHALKRFLDRERGHAGAGWPRKK